MLTAMYAVKSERKGGMRTRMRQRPNTSLVEAGSYEVLFYRPCKISYLLVCLDTLYHDIGLRNRHFLFGVSIIQLIVLTVEYIYFC